MNSRPARWLFTGAIALQITAPSGHVFATWVPGTPADGSDWIDYLDSLDELIPVGGGEDEDEEVREAQSALA